MAGVEVWEEAMIESGIAPSETAPWNIRDQQITPEIFQRWKKGMMERITCPYTLVFPSVLWQDYLIDHGVLPARHQRKKIRGFKRRMRLINERNVNHEPTFVE